MTSNHQRSKRVRLVSTFGLGSPRRRSPEEGEAIKTRRVYTSAVYQWRGVNSSPTTHVQRALIELFSATSVGGVTTQEVVNEWIRFEPKSPVDEEHRGDRLGRDVGLWSNYSKMRDLPRDHPLPKAYLKLVDGAQEDALYYTFEAYRSLLSHEPLEALGEVEPPDEIIFDVTHGFRTQPIIGLAAALFTLQEQARLELSDQEIPTLRVVYGAFEDRSLPNTQDNTLCKPIWDITPFLTLQQINNGLTSLITYGRSELLEEVIEDVGEEAPAWLKRLKQVTREVSADLNLIRAQDLAQRSAPELKEATDRALSELCGDPKWQMLSESLQSLRHWAEDLSISPTDDSLESAAGLDLFKRLARRYQRLRQYPALLAVIAEGKITQQKLNRGLTDRPTQPDHEFGALRNSVMHAQLDRGKPGRDELLAQLDEHLSALEALTITPTERQALKSGCLILCLPKEIVSDTIRDGVERELGCSTARIAPSALRRELNEMRCGSGLPIRLDSKLSKYKGVSWVMSPKVATNPRLTSIVSTLASADQGVYWYEEINQDTIEVHALDFTPSIWLSGS